MCEYENLELEIIFFDSDDIIVTSGEGNGDVDTDLVIGG